jgi:hypothetical protein
VIGKHSTGLYPCRIIIRTFRSARSLGVAAWLILNVYCGMVLGQEPYQAVVSSF